MIHRFFASQRIYYGLCIDITMHASTVTDFLSNIYYWIFFGLWNSIIVKDFRFFFSCNVSKKLPPSTNIPHPIGIVIGSDVPIGKNCTIMQNVTIGIRRLEENSGPKIGDGVTICSGAAVLGDVTVGDHSVIGANSIVLSDVPENTVVAGSPAEKINVNMEK